MHYIACGFIYSWRAVHEELHLHFLPFFTGLFIRCSIYRAANAPAPIQLKEVQAGVDRNRIIAVLGMPRSTEVNADNERTDMHEYIDGNPQESKARIVLYVAGDIFTLGIAELLFGQLKWQRFKAMKDEPLFRMTEMARRKMFS